MKYSLTLLDTSSEIRNNIFNSIKPLLDKAIDKTINKLRPLLVDLIRSALISEPEYSSLISGTLRSELGIADTSNVDAAVNNIANSIVINKKSISVNNLGFTGGIELNLINNQDFGGALNDASAFVNDTERGYSLPWLEWLLLKGNAIIIKNYEVKFGPSPKYRSGDALMIQSSSSWRVPPEFAGTIKDNWTTRALNRIDNKIINLIQTTLENSI